MFLSVQKELFDDVLDLEDTVAGWELDKDIRKSFEQWQVEVKRLREEAQEMQNADDQRVLNEQRNNRRNRFFRRFGLRDLCVSLSEIWQRNR